MTVTIFHNPDCGTSRNVLGILRHAGIEPEVIEYLKTPPTKEKLHARDPHPPLSAGSSLVEHGED